MGRIEQRLDSVDRVLDRHLELLTEISTRMATSFARIEGRLEQIDQRLGRIELHFQAPEQAA
ncbi:MAG TPA: hypothetical protein VGJ60_07475 [Chloroflexota bacterium]